jgi:hypothetical protein
MQHMYKSLPTAVAPDWIVGWTLERSSELSKKQIYGSATQDLRLTVKPNPDEWK